MEGFLFSTPMTIYPVDGEPHMSYADEIIESPVGRDLFSSEGESIVEPYEGMEFESEEAARVFYNAYASRIGFKVRVSSFIRSKRDKTIISRQLVCSREGFRSTKDAESEGRAKRPRMITRVGCKAMIMVKKQSSGRWVISKCENIHNHELGTHGKVVMLPYDPYVCHNEGMVENSIEKEANSNGGVVGNNYEMVVVPPVGNPDLEPQEGMEFESEQDAQIFYKEYARRVGFRARVSSYYRSKRDNSIISRLIVCSKEGFRAKKDENTEERLQRARAVTRVGCKAMLMVKKRISGKWVVSKLVKNHNHVLTPRTKSDDERSEAEEDEILGQFEKSLVANEGDATTKPYEGMEFESEEAAKLFYYAYSRRAGFNMRVSTYYRSKRDKSIISRLFVCCKEGFYVKKDTSDKSKIKRPREATRIGCKAMLMVKKNNSGKWVVSKFEEEHNHALGSLRKRRKLRKRTHLSSTSKMPKNQSDQDHSDQESPTSRYNNLCREAIRYAEAGAASTDVYNVAMHALQEAVKKVAVAAIKKNVDETSSSKLRMYNTCRQPRDQTSQHCPTKQVNTVPCEQISMVDDEPFGELLEQCD